jgi:signal transduction histidine kinase
MHPRPDSDVIGACGALPARREAGLVLHHRTRMKPIRIPDMLSRWIVIGPFLIVVALLAALGAEGVDILSAARAYVGGESLWSKGQKDAVYHLGRYVQSHDEAEWQKYQQALAVPLGDREARLELDRPGPDLDKVRAGFLAGGNHPEDIDGLIRLYRRFGRIPFMAEAIAIWAEGDAGIAELRALGEHVHLLIASGRADSGELRATLAQLPALNERLTGLEQRFSAQLGEASRISQNLVLVATLVLAAVLALLGVVLTSRILRRQQRAERALRTSNERWEMAGAAAGIGVFEWDVRERRIALDVRAAALYGIALDAPGVVGTARTRDAIHPDDRPRLRQALRDALAKRAPLSVRYRVRLANGVERHLELNAHGGNGNGEEATRLIGILQDVTDDVKAEQLQFDKEAAERANRAKTEFLSRVSHELRTPLNAILGFTQLMQVDRADPLTPAQATRVAHVLAGGQHLLGLINDVLDLTSIDQGAFTLVAREVDLVELLRGCVSRVEPLTHAHGVTVEFEPAPAEARVLADPLRLEQVFANLLSNAIKYNRTQGKVAVRLRAEGEAFAVAVADQGAGLGEAKIAQLFQPFNRLGAEFSKVQGSGLGLVITRQLIERMGGMLEVESKPGAGSIFTVRIPRGEAAVQDKDAKAGHAGLDPASRELAVAAMDSGSGPE